MDEWEEILAGEIERKNPTPPSRIDRMISKVEAETRDLFASRTETEESPCEKWDSDASREWDELSTSIRALEKKLMAVRNTGNIRVDKLRSETRTKTRQQISELRPRFQELENLRRQAQSSTK